MTHQTRGRKVAVSELRRLDGILDLLRDHLSNGGSPDDWESNRLYRDYYGTGARLVSLDAVRAWAERNATPPAAATTDGAGK